MMAPRGSVPAKASMYKPMARPLTHSGDMSCAVAFRFARVHTQAIPTTTRATNAVVIDRARPRPTPATPTNVTVAGSDHRPSPEVTGPLVKAPIRAPAPIAPRRRPNAPAPPPNSSVRTGRTDWITEEVNANIAATAITFRNDGVNLAKRTPRAIAFRIEVCSRSGESMTLARTTRTTITPRYDKALSPNATCAPATATMNPPSAGPIARATLKAAELRATALATNPRGTRSGTVACQDGRLNASPVPSSRPRPSNRPGVISPAAVRIAIAAAEPPIVIWATIRTFRRSNMSAMAPAGREKTRSGSVDEADMSPTHRAESVNSSINHEAATA